MPVVQRTQNPNVKCLAIKTQHVRCVLWTSLSQGWNLIISKALSSTQESSGEADPSESFLVTNTGSFRARAGARLLRRSWADQQERRVMPCMVQTWMLVPTVLILGAMRQVRCWEYSLTSLAQRLDYSWSYFTGQSPWFLCRNGPEIRAVGRYSQNKQRAGHRVWMFQAKMESQGSAGLRMPQNTGNCPRWGVSKDRRTSFISCRPTCHLPLQAALTTCPLRFCYMRTT